MPIALNNYLELRDTENGKQLFGKCGYQVMSAKTDKFTAANLAAIERALDAGELLDIDGVPTKDNAVIQVLVRVTKVKAAGDIEQVGSITNIGGGAVSVPAAPAATDSDNPLE